MTGDDSADVIALAARIVEACGVGAVTVLDVRVARLRLAGCFRDADKWQAVADAAEELAAKRLIEH